MNSLQSRRKVSIAYRLVSKESQQEGTISCGVLLCGFLSLIGYSLKSEGLLMLGFGGMLKVSWGFLTSVINKVAIFATSYIPSQGTCYCTY